MKLSRLQPKELRQLASQVLKLPVADLRACENFLPDEETIDFLHGLICGLGVADPQVSEKEHYQRAVIRSVLAERILKFEEDKDNLPPLN